MGRDIIVDNGSYDAAGLQTLFGFLPTITPLSNNYRCCRPISGNITLNSPVRLQGGGGTGGTGFDEFDRQYLRPGAILSSMAGQLSTAVTATPVVPHWRTRLHLAGNIPGHPRRLSSDRV